MIVMLTYLFARFSRKTSQDTGTRTLVLKFTTQLIWPIFLLYEYVKITSCDGYHRYLPIGFVVRYLCGQRSVAKKMFTCLPAIISVSWIMQCLFYGCKLVCALFVHDVAHTFLHFSIHLSTYRELRRLLLRGYIHKQIKKQGRAILK